MVSVGLSVVAAASLCQWGLVVRSGMLLRFVRVLPGEREVGGHDRAAVLAVAVVVAVREHAAALGGHEVHPRADIVRVPKAAVPREVRGQFGMSVP